MKLYRFLVLGGVLLVVAGLVLVSTAAPVLAQDDAQPSAVGEPPTFLRGIYDAWVGSPHADAEAEAFVHWDGDGEVEANCAQCHSTPGYIDYLGADGSEAGVVDAAAPLGTVVNCDACHNAVASNLTTVTFPSGAEVTNLSDSTRCMVCHQGRASSVSVNNALESAGVVDDLDVVSQDLRFINIHYYAAAASLYGSEAMGGYQYEGKTYQPRFNHVEGYDSCADCHNPHTLEIKFGECETCHEDVEDAGDLEDIRMPGSLIDYDGDGDIREGIIEEIDTLQEMLYEAMQLYAANVAGTPIAYSVSAYPYFFIDGNGNGEVDADEAVRENGYNAFTGRLLQAAYNYQVSLKDPGAFAHNAKYHIELLYDSIESLNSAMEDGVDLSEAHRNDPGHFDATAEAFRHWDEDGEVSASCTKCHTAVGLPFFIEHGTTIAFEPTDSLSCTTCHSSIPEFDVYELNEVKFPSGMVGTFGEAEPDNICLNCHQGRESGVSVDAAISRAGVGDDEVSEALRFQNPHYFAAGATLFGADAHGMYEFEGKEYDGRNFHTRNYDSCSGCHNTHSLEIYYEDCSDCHDQVEEPEDVVLIRLEDEDAEAVDYDGDGDVEEPILDEITSFQDALYAEIVAYTTETLGTPIVYNPARYPYWFTDMDGDGVQGEDDVAYPNWSPNLLRGAYNFQWAAKDPGKFAHNPDYVLQVLYDSIEALGGEDAVASFTRAPVRVAED